MEVWALTFNRPVALNRLIENFGKQGVKVNIFSNHPEVKIARTNADKGYLGDVVVNTLNFPESNSWCARSWNSIMLRAFQRSDDCILIQDDTDISDDFVEWITEKKKQYNFIWGPAGDQFHYLTVDVLATVGWWDERYIGCYCGDADFVKRVAREYPRNRISVQDSHNWGFNFNECGVDKHVITTYRSKTIDPDYDNQHWEFEKSYGCTTDNNPAIVAAQTHYREKWGVDLDINQPVDRTGERLLKEINWYPWATKKLGIRCYD